MELRRLIERVSKVPTTAPRTDVALREAGGGGEVGGGTDEGGGALRGGVGASTSDSLAARRARRCACDSGAAGGGDRRVRERGRRSMRWRDFDKWMNVRAACVASAALTVEHKPTVVNAATLGVTSCPAPAISPSTVSATPCAFGSERAEEGRRQRLQGIGTRQPVGETREMCRGPCAPASAG